MKKLTVFITLVILLTTIGYAKEESTNAFEIHDKKVKEVNDDLYPLKKDNKWGFVNFSGKWIIKPQFEAFVKLGKFIMYRKNKRAGLTDKNGKIIISPRFDGFRVSDKTIIASLYGKTGIINTKEQWILEPKYKSLYFDKESNLLKAKFNTKWGYINKKGDWIIKPDFDYISDFHKNGIAICEKNKKYGLIDKNGKVLIQPKYNDIYVKDEIIIASLDGKSGIINTNGQWILEPKYDDLFFDHKSDFLKAKYNKKWGCIDKKGKWVLNPTYERIEYCPINNLAIVIKDDKAGVVNSKGRWVLEPKYYEVKYASFTDSLFFVCIDDKFIYGLVDKNGNWIKKPMYEDVDGFYDNGLAIVQVHKKFGVIDKSGKWILEPKFENIKFFGKLIRVKFGDTMGYTLLNGKYLTFSKSDYQDYLNDKKLYLNEYLTVKEGSVFYFILSKRLKKYIRTNRDYIKIVADTCPAKKGYCSGTYNKNDVRVNFDILLQKKDIKVKNNKRFNASLYIANEKEDYGYDAFYSMVPLNIKKLNLPQAQSLIGRLFSFSEGSGRMPELIFIDTEEQTLINFLSKIKKEKEKWHPPYLIKGTNCVDHDDVRNGEWLGEMYQKGGVLDSKGCLINSNY